MSLPPSTNDLLDDRSLRDTQSGPEGNSDLKIDGLPIEEFVEPVAASAEQASDSACPDDRRTASESEEPT